MSIPRIAITPGEPAGIGPDIVLMAAQREWDAELVVIADPELLQQRAAILQLPLELVPHDQHAAPRRHTPGRLGLVATRVTEPVVAGQLATANAHYVLQSLQLAVAGCSSGDFAAMVTAPVQKSIINDAGIAFSGHTEFLAQATATERVVMLLAADQLRVALATTHLPLAQVPAAITAELLEQVLDILHRDLQQKFGIANPCIAVLGLNPHAGEGGHMGREEIDVIQPTLERLRDRGLNLKGPLPADTAFNAIVREQCDAYLAMYHDQGLPVLKYAGFGEAVNITLGLPIIRTSVDHGTALDLAGTGGANPGSLVAALQLALQMHTASQAAA